MEVPSLVTNPQARADLAIGQELASAASPLGQDLMVMGGNPTVIVRDQFTTDTPKRVIRSKSGEFELHVFETTIECSMLKPES